ncbi:Na(+)-translocating NADH-quinone reductase subunit F [Winogradskyella wichelsiae]|uniref:Na(+)-translocating NADH-quinone reductase subunit F n=1 Tax=Winogradskyella wichelsiae TaxID=2697007 RepID=UPI0015CAA06E|nr:Na(+)-translocating NADH-quinone reductase subunit F [Winogradskyella wichelsiae]
MKSSLRFDNAITKLYKAFHHNTLNPEDFKQCAVGNILDNKDSWQHLTNRHGTTQLNYIGLVHQNMKRRFNGYLPNELLSIENAFLKGCDYHFTATMQLHRPENINDDKLFNGLCAVVSLLCSFDGRMDVMDCSKLFNYERSNSNRNLNKQINHFR